MNAMQVIEVMTVRECLQDQAARIAELEGALRKYGKHQNDPEHFCNRLRHSDYACDCGFEDLKLTIE